MWPSWGRAGAGLGQGWGRAGAGLGQGWGRAGAGLGRAESGAGQGWSALWVGQSADSSPDTHTAGSGASRDVTRKQLVVLQVISGRRRGVIGATGVTGLSAGAGGGTGGSTEVTAETRLRPSAVPRRATTLN